MALPEKESQRFDRSLIEIGARGGGVRLVSWPNATGDRVPECNAEWGNIATMLRAHIAASNSRVSLELTPTGRATEQISATWIKAEREPHAQEYALSEDAMDTLVFDDGTKFHFDDWSDGHPYALVSIKSTQRESILQSSGKWILSHLAQVVVGVLVIVLAAILGLGGE